MTKRFPVELVYQVFSLLIAFILVHALYVTLIRPQANAFLEQEAANAAANPEYVQQRSFYVVIKDYEQETCFGLPDTMRDYLLPRALLTAVERFGATRNVQDVSNAARDICESEGERMESELSIIRYIAWAIPSVGFIGTVRGIGNALGQAHRAVEGDITGVTTNLAVAFNSTFIALVISIVLMFFIHQLQLMQERLVLDSERYIDHWLIRRLVN